MTYSELDELAQRMREGIINTVRPFFVEGDSFSSLMFQTLRRMLQRADVVDLSNVLIASQEFIDEMRPFLDEYRTYQEAITDELSSSLSIEADESDGLSGDDGEADASGDDAGSGERRDGSGDTDREDSLREEHTSSVHHSDVYPTVQPDGEGPSSGHEAEMAGGTDSNGAVTEETVS